MYNLNNSIKRTLQSFNLVFTLSILSIITSCTTEPKKNTDKVEEKEELSLNENTQSILSASEKKSMIGKVNWAEMNGKTSEAMTICNSLIEGDSTFSEAYSARASIKFKLKDYDGALSDFNQAITIDSVNPEYYRGKSLVLSINNKKEALKTIMQAIKLSNNNGFNLIAKGRIELELGNNKVAKNDFEKSVQEFTNAIKREPKNPMYRYGRAVANIQLGNTNDICDDLRFTLRNKIEDAREIYNLYCKKEK